MMIDYISTHKHPYGKKVLLAMIAFMLLAAISIGVTNTDILSMNAKPVTDNVLNIPYGATWDESGIITSPWKNLQFHTGLMFRSLFSMDSTSEKIETDMVDSYEILEDGMKYKFSMKEDLLWSDGKPITAEDVAFSMEAVLRASDANGIYPSAFKNIQGADDFLAGEADHIMGIQIDGNIITLEMAQIYPAFIEVLTQFVILPKHCLENEDLEMLHVSKFWTNPIVSGMYKFGEVTPYKTIQLVRNEYYVGTPPKIEEVMIQLDYKHADLDYHTTNNSTEIINYRSMKEMEEYPVDVLLYRYLVFNLQGSETNENIAIQENQVRQAISYAIDREKLLKNIYFDFGNIIDSGVPRSSDSYNKIAIEYNPEKAKEILENSNYDLKRPLRLAYYYTDSVSRYFMESIASDLKQVGFDVELIHIKVSSEIYDGREYDILLKGLSAFGLNEWYAEYTSANINMSKLLGTDSEFETLVKKFNSEVDQSVAHVTLLELQALEQGKMYKLPLFTLNQMVYIRSERVSIPKDITFKNTWYKYDVNFEEWYIKTE